MVSNGKASHTAHLGAGHFLAAVAARHCRGQHAIPVSARLGRIACGRCWEYVIRADERVAVEFGLPPVDPVEAAAYLDEVAIRRACKGERMELTRAERVEAVRRLHDQGVGVDAIANRLHVSRSRVCRDLNRPSTRPAGGEVTGVAA